MTEGDELGLRLDRALQELAAEAGAAALSVPDTIPGEILDRAGYFEAFPGTAIPAPVNGSFFPPAACYHVYRHLRGARLDAPCMVTLATTCGREEARASDDAGRLRLFRMREIVFIGPPDWVVQTREDWMTRATAFASALGLTGTLEPATDTFFGPPGRGRRLIQQLKNLKCELRMTAGPAGVLAVASFNLHESFFAGRFDIRMADESPAASGCAAFGIERWALACRHHGHAYLR
jgi:seryl-tRNA synthetase